MSNLYLLKVDGEVYKYSNDSIIPGKLLKHVMENWKNVDEDEPYCSLFRDSIEFETYSFSSIQDRDIAASAIKSVVEECTGNYQIPNGYTYIVTEEELHVLQK